MWRRVLLLVTIAMALAATAAGSAAAPTAADASVAERSCATRAPVGDRAMPPTPNDYDCDHVTDSQDNCPQVPNGDQANSDADRDGDACDSDDDNDGVPDLAPDNCRTVPNPGQEDADGDGIGDVCFVDHDGDAIVDPRDNCPLAPNGDQTDTDRDGSGDACDADDDDDYFLDPTDNCVLLANPDQVDRDADGIGDACDPAIASPRAPGPVSPSGGGSGLPRDDRPRADRTAPRVRARLARVQRRSDVMGGMPVAVRCSEACAIVAVATVSGRDAVRIRMARSASRRIVVARADAALGGAGSTFAFFELARGAARRLFAGRPVPARLELSVVDAAGNRTIVRRALQFRR